MAFRPKNDNFVPDRRCNGWWTTNIVEFKGVNGGKLVSCTKTEVEASVNNQIKSLLDVYCRYRIYAHDSGLLIMSVREEDVDHVCDALYNFRLERPQEEHFLCTKIGSEKAPYYKDMLPELRDLLHNYHLKAILESDDPHPQEVIRRNYVQDMVDVLIKRTLIEYTDDPKRDVFIRGICSQLFLFPCSCRNNCMWKCFKNIIYFQDLVEKKGTRSLEDREKSIGELLNMTKAELEDKLENDRKAFIDSLGGDQNDKEYEDDKNLEILPDYTDNQPMRNADVYYGRGLYLSHSTTYPDWIAPENPEASKNGESAEKEVESNSTPIEIKTVTLKATSKANKRQNKSMSRGARRKGK